MKVVEESSIDARVNVSMVTMSKPCWMDLIIDFLADDRMLTDEKEAEKVRREATWYWLSADRMLYRRSFGGPSL